MTLVQSVVLLALVSAAQGQSLTSSEPVVSRAGEPVSLSCKVVQSEYGVYSFLFSSEEAWGDSQSLLQGIWLHI
ncbi:Protein unc-93 like A [Dissostichus eleginoides]|uniref:Protein unc-93 like A n=1 Tax=Dissostichus eleginoides TaxID=100907 RepID=A0AAD9B7A0_DISEL|nr:Protein unc-93 like A [Dissostichus eleginoides]